MRVKIRDIETNYEVTGTGGTIVMLHSLGYNLHLYDDICGELSKKFNVIRYDLRGHGGTTLGDKAPSLDVLADDLRQLISVLGIRRAHFVGQSIGAMTLLCAACHKYLEGSLFLLDTIGWTDEAWDRKYASRAKEVEREGLAALSFPLAQASLGRTTVFETPAILDSYAAQLRKAPQAGYAWGCRAMIGFDFRPELKDITMPTLVLTGDEDQVATVDLVRQLAGRISSAVAKTIQGSGHLPVIEQPAVVLSELNDWISNQTPSN